MSYKAGGTGSDIGSSTPWRRPDLFERGAAFTDRLVVLRGARMRRITHYLHQNSSLYLHRRAFCNTNHTCPRRSKCSNDSSKSTPLSRSAARTRLRRSSRTAVAVDAESVLESSLSDFQSRHCEAEHSFGCTQESRSMGYRKGGRRERYGRERSVRGSTLVVHGCHAGYLDGGVMRT